METYAGFAEVYDTFMDNVPYDGWAAYLHGLFREYQVTDGLMLELGCGTGSMTERMAAFGYDMIGVDQSEEMLGVAMEKKMDSGHDILYLQQDGKLRQDESDTPFRSQNTLRNRKSYRFCFSNILLFRKTSALPPSFLFFCFRQDCRISESASSPVDFSCSL